MRWANVDSSWQLAWQATWSEVSASRSAASLITLPQRIEPHLVSLRTEPLASDGQESARSRLEAFVLAIEEGARRAAAGLRDRFQELAARYSELALETDFTLLYNAQRKLFSIGYNLDEARLDRGHYDLLASESRLASLVAIAKGDVDHRHWFQLGRTLTETEGTKTLLSWGGTMFEFMMPPLFARDFEGSLLDQSCCAAVHRQMAYGKQRGVPWGISESAFSAQAANSDYHYQSFGVPGAGNQTGPGEGPGRFSLFDGAGFGSRSVRLRGELPRFDRRGGRRRMGPVRCTRLFSQSRSRGGTPRGRVLLYGTSPRHDAGGTGELPVGSSDAAPFSRAAPRAARPICCCKRGSCLPFSSFNRRLTKPLRFPSYPRVQGLSAADCRRRRRRSRERTCCRTATTR